jgi:hypothetical protein
MFVNDCLISGHPRTHIAPNIDTQRRIYLLPPSYSFIVWIGADKAFASQPRCADPLLSMACLTTKVAGPMRVGFQLPMSTFDARVASAAPFRLASFRGQMALSKNQRNHLLSIRPQRREIATLHLGTKNGNPEKKRLRLPISNTARTKKPRRNKNKGWRGT